MPPLLVPLSICPLLAVWLGLLFLFSQQLEHNLFGPPVLSKPLDLRRFPSPSWRW